MVSGVFTVKEEERGLGRTLVDGTTATLAGGAVGAAALGAIVDTLDGAAAAGGGRWPLAIHREDKCFSDP